LIFFFASFNPITDIKINIKSYILLIVNSNVDNPIIFPYSRILIYAKELGMSEISISATKRELKTQDQDQATRGPWSWKEHSRRSQGR